MADEIKAEGNKSCCSGERRCCGCGMKVIGAIVLLLLGGISGFLLGSHCGMHKSFACPMTMAPANK